MNKKLYFLIGIILIAGSFFYFWSQKTNSQKNFSEESEVFSIVDEEKNNLVWDENKNLNPELEKQYQDKLEKAKSDLAGVQEITEENKEAVQSYYNNIALYSTYLGDYRQAYDYYIKSLELYPDDRIVWLNLGSLLVEMNALQSAEKAIDIGLNWNPYDNVGWLKKIALYEENFPENSENTEKISDFYKEAIEKTNNDPLLVNDYANWLAKNGKNDEAINIYRKLIELTPENKEAIQKKIEKLN